MYVCAVRVRERGDDRVCGGESEALDMTVRLRVEFERSLFQGGCKR